MRRRSVEVTLDDHTVARLEETATQRGIDLEQLILELLCQADPPPHLPA